VSGGGNHGEMRQPKKELTQRHEDRRVFGRRCHRWPQTRRQERKPGARKGRGGLQSRWTGEGKTKGPMHLARSISLPDLSIQSRRWRNGIRAGMARVRLRSGSRIVGCWSGRVHWVRSHPMRRRVARWGVVLLAALLGGCFDERVRGPTRSRFRRRWDVP
jgi:hypothetical protein